MKKQKQIKSKLKIKKRERKRSAMILGIIAFLMVIGGAYVLLLCYAPKLSTIPFIMPDIPRVSYTAVGDDRLYIPKIDVNKDFMTGGEGVLDRHVWHRFAERGDPERGGNFILAAHRFQFAFWPGETVARSPFYNLNLLEPGDPIYVDYHGKRYKYEVVKRYTVRPDDTYIENVSEEPKMTLYSCTLKGSEDGREVVEARVVERDLDVHVQFWPK